MDCICDNFLLGDRFIAVATELCLSVSLLVSEGLKGSENANSNNSGGH